MKNINDEKQTFHQILDLIADHFGSNCEVVLHDLTKGYDHTIVDIVNGHITNREIGDCGSNLGLEILRGTVHNGDRFNYITHTPSGRILRSSSIYIKDDEGQVIGSVCINLDITETVQFEGFLKNFNHYEIDEHGIEEKQEEVFVKDVNDLLDHLIQQAQVMIGKPIDQMSKEEKITFVGFLDKKGAFLITKSGDKVCELLNISKFTLYNYLEIYRKGCP
jgi:predicted transcriptional regulator YheO